ncbi:MAG: 4-hydroxy-3-methylbut-2-enyl diphosphate reductase [Actinobacteria bacterium]|nr:4-hydroxy-3-methylbut-2-enyl diphosphate reductase [Actinomycetota bacterium]
MPDSVILAQPRGFCAGVEMAIKALTWMVQVFEPPVYCYHEIVHNAAVVDAFERAGVIFVEHVDEVPEGRPVMLSAHGSAPEVVAAARGRAAVMVDAVCPLVTKVHHDVRRMANKGYDIIYVGHAGHDEAKGAVAQAKGSVTLVDPDDSLADFHPRDTSKVALAAQTTLGQFEWEDILSAATSAFPGLHTARKSDLCYATTNRQAATIALAQQVSLVLVVGSRNSSNTQALVRVAKLHGAAAYRVDGPGDVDPAWLDDHDVVGVTAGASAPDQRVQEVIAAINPTNGVDVLAVSDEDEYFPLPPSLRKLILSLQYLVEGAVAARLPGQTGPIQGDRAHSATESLGLLDIP